MEFGNGHNPFDRMQVTSWVDGFDSADVQRTGTKVTRSVDAAFDYDAV